MDDMHHDQPPKVLLDFDEKEDSDDPDVEELPDAPTEVVEVPPIPSSPNDPRCSNICLNCTVVLHCTTTVQILKDACNCL